MATLSLILPWRKAMPTEYPALDGDQHMTLYATSALGTSILSEKFTSQPKTQERHCHQQIQPQNPKVLWKNKEFDLKNHFFF